MIDLHMHTVYSRDGTFFPSELTALCARSDITVMSVTDHNCAQGNREAAACAADANIRFLAGIEIDCTHQGRNYHLLGYGIDFQNADFRQIEEADRQRELQASTVRREKLHALGFLTDAEELHARFGEIWTGEMFAELLLGSPAYSSHPLLAPYRSGGTRGDNPFVNFYWDFFSQGKPCYAPVHYPEMAATVMLIHRNGGAAVLAHPGANLDGGAVPPQILALGIDGIEAYSSYHTSEQAAAYAAQAQAHGLFTTCGSDFHGKTKPSIVPGGYPRPAHYRLPDALEMRLYP